MEVIHTIVYLAVKGGIFMIPLALCGLTALGLVIERLLFLRENHLDWDRFHFELKSALKDNDLDRAIVLAARTRGVVGRVMQECLLRVQAGQTDVQHATEKDVLSEMASMERSRGWLATMIQIAPLLGLIGTVQGMIMIFMTIERSATMDPRNFAGGIYTKLITTFSGLFIAIPAMVAQEHIRRQTNLVLHYLDLYLLEVRDWVQHRPAPEMPRSLAAKVAAVAADPATLPVAQPAGGGATTVMEMARAASQERAHA